MHHHVYRYVPDTVMIIYSINDHIVKKCGMHSILYRTVYKVPQYIIMITIVTMINPSTYTLLYMLYASITTDIDECKKSNDVCDHICTNTNGSYQCSCHDGYSLEENKSHCVGMRYCMSLLIP